MSLDSFYYLSSSATNFCWGTFWQLQSPRNAARLLILLSFFFFFPFYSFAVTELKDLSKTTIIMYYGPGS